MKRHITCTLLSVLFALLLAHTALADITLTASAKGLLSYVSVTVDIKDDGTITNISVDCSGETSFIVEGCTEYEFLSQFIGRSGPFTDIDTVAGATHASNAIIEAVNSLYSEVISAEGAGLDSAYADYQAERNERRYNEAMDDLESGNYYDAQLTFAQLGDYKDSKTLAETSQLWPKYNKASALLDKAEYQEAYTAFQELGDFNDSAEKAYVLRLATIADTTSNMGDLIRYSLHGLWGLLDFNDNLITPPKWDSIAPGIGDLVIVEKDKLYGLMDKNGQVKIHPRFEILCRTMDGYFIAANQSDKHLELYLLNHFGNMLTPDGCLAISTIHTSEDLAAPRIGIFPDENPIPVQTVTGKWGFMMYDGLWAIQPKYDDALFFSEGLAAVKAGDYWQYINEQNKVVISGKYTQATSFSDGLAHVYLKDHGWQIIDSAGTVIYFGN